MFNIRRSFPAKLSLSILLLAVPIFVISLGVLFTQSRYLIRKQAVGRANSVLNIAMQHLDRNLLAVKTATDVTCWQVEQTLEPDSILNFTNLVVRLNGSVDGCSISMEPDVFPQHGRHFSAYTVREGDTITTVIEQEYDYFSKIWYKTPRELNKSCWVLYYDDADSLELTLDGMVASYGRPLYREDNSLVGIISTDLSLQRLSRIISSEKPYPNSYFVMVDQDGHYIIHPDSTRLFSETIFSGADPTRQADVFALGHEMTRGARGNMTVFIGGEPCIVCYRPVPDTSWSLAVICPDSDVLKGYQKLTYILVPLLVVGLILIFLLCNRTVAQAIRPLNLLLDKTQSIAGGNLEVHIPHSKSRDSIGRLQNSFAGMLQSLNFHMGSVRYVSDQTRKRNEELIEATQMVQEADRQKTAFMQNVSHQIRTPLNIIMGFAQVLSETAKASRSASSIRDVMSEEEMKSISSMMGYNAKHLCRQILMLFDSSDTGLSQELNSHQGDMVSCNGVARESIDYIKEYHPEIPILFETNVEDDYCIQTNHLYLMRSLRELLYNAAKYSNCRHIVMRVVRTEVSVRFIVEDKGKGIAEANHEAIFEFFAKVDDLSEGLGLGLPLSKRHAQNMGGNLTLDTDYHEGCRFILELPTTDSRRG